MTSDNGPQHIGIILDGNRRFAKRLMLEPWKGHEFGKEKLEKLLDWCNDLGVKELTVYAFSMQNFNRPKNEFDYLMKIFKKAFTDMLTDPRIDENKIRVNVIGRIQKFDEELQSLIKQIMEKTKDNNGFIFNMALAYGGREELVDAIKKIGRKIEAGEVTDEKIDEDLIDKYVYMPDQPDLIIRTGGERRSSNFLLWQSGYSEWIYLEKKWPEFEKEDLIDCVEEFKTRERRFGK